MKVLGVTWRWNRCAKWIRRFHLYSGLVLVPFVVLYGVTAFLFNHPTFASDRSVQYVPVDALQLGRVAEASSMEAIVQALQDAQERKDWEWDPTQEMRFRGRYVVGFREGDREHSWSLEDLEAPARWTTRIRRAEPETSAVRNVELMQPKAIRDALTSAVERVAAAEAMQIERVEVRSMPKLEFAVRVDAETRPASFDLLKQQLTIADAAAEAPHAWRNFLLRMHTAHGYPDRLGWASFWAGLVDAMAVAMVLWALSGVLMWWQMRFLRRMGLLALFSGCVLALVMGRSMWQAFT